jgi:excisionase family DNA binding protein
MSESQTVLLSVPQVAQRLAVKESTVRAWLLRRRLAHVKVGRRAVRVPVGEVERIVREGSVPAQEGRR